MHCPDDDAEEPSDYDDFYDEGESMAADDAVTEALSRW